jgi:hypothetical protein
VHLRASLRVPLWLLLFLLCTLSTFAQRKDISLNSGWSTALANTNQWKPVNIPHNWDDYYGYRRLLHGNLHGDALYKKTFTVPALTKDKKAFLFFEGVGSYATVYVNNKLVGSHAGGRTTFTLDITKYINKNTPKNELLVKVAHPSNIKDLPWVCGACSDERGFSEGSQPLGIFRPVHLIITNAVRIEPFGVHAWAEIRDNTATLYTNTTLKNYSEQNRNIIITSELRDAVGKKVAEFSTPQILKRNDSIAVLSTGIKVNDPELWSVENPYLYKIITSIEENNLIIDKTETDFGFRTINFKTASHQFLLNGKPVFINGIAEYEHLLGQSHAFSNEEIEARMKWIQSAGFNAFRDAHQPHNLLYGKLCNEKGLLWWTQFSAHVWYDTKAFRENFKNLLREWVIERRNDPAVILWGLQNESKLPKDFAAECTALIRSLDPTASAQRLVTTCNGGEGTDWDVPQNWTGTYGGDPATYAADIKKQILIGEYGAWRTLDLHSEGGFKQNGILSEDRMVQLMEQKIRLAESVKDSCAGQFFWLLTSHDNPGRVQGGEGQRELDRIGPVNYKGLLTPWEEPTDAYYMFRSNYVSNKTAPMVYIASHTWPNRWMTPGIKDSINVYSNCDEVELFNDIDNASLGKQKRNGIGTHFQWNKVNIKYNVLYAVGYVNGQAVARDTIVLFHLPPAPDFIKLYNSEKPVTKPQPGYNYIYRINCGGADYKDAYGNIWQADKGFSESWTNDFPEMPAAFASQRRVFAPIKNTRDWKLFQDFRYGKNKLQYQFPLPDGEYLLELYFIEPWIKDVGDNLSNLLRVFDVAVNGRVVLNDVDVYNEAGANTALKKTVKVKIKGGKMIIDFPETKAGQALISAVAVASLNKAVTKYQPERIITGLSCSDCELASWLDIGDTLYRNAGITVHELPSNLYGADWLKFNNYYSNTESVQFQLTEDADVCIAVKSQYPPRWLFPEYENTQMSVITDEGNYTNLGVYRKRFLKGSRVSILADPGMMVMLIPANHMQPAYDLKPLTSYRTNVAAVIGSMQKQTINGRECAVVTDAQQAMVQWPVQIGAADIYSVTVKYYYSRETVLKGKLQLFDAGNNRMMEQEVNFTFTKPGKWNQFTINTGTQINAGNYTVKLVLENGESLAVSGIEIQ